MKKIHLMLLIIAAITAITSAYSLAAINQVYTISFDWYSEYQNKFVNENRDTTKDKWSLNDYPTSKKIRVISDLDTFTDVSQDEDFSDFDLTNLDFNKHLLIYCSLGKFTSPEYRIKVADIAQRGDVVEVVLSVNSPSKDILQEGTFIYAPMDLVRVDKDAFPIKGKLLFVFKNNDGTQLAEQYCELK